MKKHRNSQKRIFIEDGTYFVTCKTQENYPYFEEKLFCDLFVENLKICKELKQFYLYAWVLMFDHFHLLLKPGEEFGLSEIMRSLKTNVSCDINRIMPSEGAVPAPRLREIYCNKFNISDYQFQFLRKHENNHEFPRFQWQKSFHDHYIRNERDFMNHWEYIKRNPEKRGMPENWPYTFLNPEYENLTDDPL